MSFVGSNILAGASGQGDAGYKIERSLRFNSADSAYLSRDMSVASSTYTFSTWIKRAAIPGSTFQYIFGSGAAGLAIAIAASGFESDNFYVFDGSSAQPSTAVFRDPSSWYHVVFSVNSGSFTLYVNGVSVKTGNAASLSTTANATSIGRYMGSGSGTYYLDAYLADTQLVDGQALNATDFGEFDDNNIWQPKKYTHATQPSTTAITNVSTSNNSGTISATAAGWQNNERCVDGNDSTVAAANNNTPGTITFSTPLVGVTKVRAKTRFWSGGTAKLYNGNTEVHTVNHNNNNTTQYYTIYEGPAITIDKYWQQMSSYGSSDDFWALEINDTLVTTSSNGGNLSVTIPGQEIVLTTTDTTNYDQFAAGTAVNNGAEVISKNTSTPSITVSAGSWSNGDVITKATNSFHLDFSDNSSSAALGTDSSGNSNTWTVNNLKVVDVFGITSACSITSSQTISFPITYAATVTYEFFVQVTSAVTYTYFAEESTASVWNIGINASGDLLFGNYTGGWTTFSSTGLADGNWHFVRLTTTGSSTSLYKDGTLLGTNASGGGVATSYSQITNRLRMGAFKVAHLRITTGGTPPTTGIPAISSMNQAAGTGGTLAFYDALDDIASSGTKTSDGGNVTITMAAATVPVSQAGVDSLIDTPTNYGAGSGNNVGNYCTLNPLDRQSTNGTLSNGNLDLTQTGSAWAMYRGTMFVSSGKWYYEVDIGNNQYTAFGILSDGYHMASATNNWPTQTGLGNTYVLYPYNGNKLDGTQSLTYTSANTSAAGDIYGVAFDLDNGTITFYRNGASLGQAFTGISGNFAPAAWLYAQSNADSYNFGQRPFKYTPPTGYKSLCTTNLPDPTIEDGSKAFDITTWTGDGSGARTVSGLNLSAAPDFVWSKTRNHGYHNNTWDSVRGYGTNATALITDYLGSANGGTLNSATASSLTFSGGVWHNENAKTYVAWAWDGGDLVTNSAYDQSQTWSSVLTSSTGFRSSEPATNAFDGSTSTICSAVGSGLITFAPTGTFPSSSAIRIYLQGSGSQTVTVNGGASQTITGNSWQTVNFTNSSASSFTLTIQASGGTDSGLRALEIGGKILVDAGFVPAGALNSSAYNTSDKWSDDLSGNTYGGASMPKSRMFNGTSGQNVIANSGTSLTFSPSGLSSISSLRIYGSSYTQNANGIVVNGTDYTSSFPQGGNSAAAWVTIPETSLTSIVWSTTSSGLENGSLMAIEVDGKLLVDNDQTPPNVPTIATEVRANPNYGFSISKADVAASLTGGPTVAHGLNAKPDFMIGKNVDSLSIYWRVFHKDLPENHYLNLNRTDAQINSSAVWGDKNSLDSNQFQIGAGTPASMWIPSGTDTCIFYAWSEVEGYSKFGSYTGNASTDGPFLYTGFRPKWLLIKKTDSTNSSNWRILDAERSSYNVIDETLFPSTSGAEAESTNNGVDFLSNGFKVRGSGNAINGSANTFIYAAFAEHPFKSSRAR